MSSVNTIKGIVYTIGQTQQVSDKFSKREIAIKTTDQYPQTILMQFSNDKCALLDNIRQGDSVSINYNLRGRTWIGKDGVEKIFNTIEGWSIVLASNETQTPNQHSSQAPFQQREQQSITQKQNPDFVQIGEDGLPF